jgi:hypothetical protein
MPGIYVKGFAFDDAKVNKTFAARLPEEKLRMAYLELIDMGRSTGFDIILGDRSTSGRATCLPWVLVLASDDDKDWLETISVDRGQGGWLQPFLEDESGIFRRY